MRLIDADELKTAFPCGERVTTESVRATIDHISTADLSEYCDKLWKTAYERGKAEAHSRTGKWVYDEERGARGIYAICTACNEMIYQTGGFNYCPNCGARMEE